MTPHPTIRSLAGGVAYDPRMSRARAGGTLRRGLRALALLAAACGPPAARAQDGATSVEGAGAVVVHGVDKGTLAELFGVVDRRSAAGEWDKAVTELDGLLSEPLDDLHEDTEGVYLAAEDAVLLRIATLPRPALALWRRLADPRGDALLAASRGRDGVAALERGARRLALTTAGPRLMAGLADARAARGDLLGALQALEDVLRFWPPTPDAPDPPGVARAALLSRFAALAAAVGDPASIDAAAAAEPPYVLDAPSVARPGTTVREELAAAAAMPSPSGPACAAPHGPVELAAEARYAAFDLGRELPSAGRELLLGQTPFALPDGSPALAVRVTNEFGTRSVLTAYALRTGPAGGAAALAPAWSWPSEEELKLFPRPPGKAPFGVAVAGDLLLFAWPSTRDEVGRGERHVASGADDLRDLVVLSIGGEGRLVDERGIGEAQRADPDEELESLSFCGPPLVVGQAVYVALVGRSPNGGATELHVARFDLVAAGPATRLQLRWRRHVLDGTPLPPARYSVNVETDLQREMAFPSGLAERFGRVYVCSNTGAVACLDGSDGRVRWIETYPRLGPSPRATAAEADPVVWKYGPVRIDGDVLVVTPRDSEELLRFAARPLPSRAMRLDGLSARGSGTATEGGSTFGELLPDEVVGVAGGVAYLSGHLPRLSTGLPRDPPAPLVAVRIAVRGPGQRLWERAVPEIPELSSAGAPALARGALLFPTYKALYRVPLDAFGGAPEELWRATLAPGVAQLPDRLGNVCTDGHVIWSVSGSRIAVFRPR